MECVAECLQQLKRSNWSWDWPTTAAESFRLPAEAFLGAYGRTGVGTGVVGVLQGTGRPYGDLELALLACQRLACIETQDAERMRHVRDQGILLCHLRRYTDAVPALAEYQQWLEGHSAAEQQQGGGNAELSRSQELDLVQQAHSKAEKMQLESAYQAS